MHWHAENISVISVAIIIGNNERIFVYSLNQIINYLNLRKPIYTSTTNYGHFGKENLPWEKVIDL